MSKIKATGLTGNISINVVKGSVFITGTLAGTQVDYDNFIKEIYDKYPDKIVFNSVSFNKLTITETNAEMTSDFEDGNDERILDELKILYVGMLPVKSIIQNPTFKLINETNKLKVDNVIKVLGAFTPLVLDKNLQVIDGNLRLQLAMENNYKELPVVVYDCEGVKANSLRLLMNRSSELQRWNFDDIDPFIDSVPQIQAIAEPLGFFGTKLLPTSFFANSIVEYVIDPFNKPQQGYRQEYGLAEWAKLRREQMAEQVKQKYAKKRSKRNDENTVSLFDLIPKEEDFLATEEPYKKAEEVVEKWELEGRRIAKVFDEKRKAEILGQGKNWQNTQRKSRVFANDERAKFEDKVRNSDLTDEQKSYILDNIDDFAGMTIKDIKEELASDVTE